MFASFVTVRVLLVSLHVNTQHILFNLFERSGNCVWGKPFVQEHIIVTMSGKLSPVGIRVFLVSGFFLQWRQPRKVCECLIFFF